MPRLRQRDLSDIRHLIAEVLPYSPRQDGGRTDDLFICALGFEERCLTLPNALASSGYQARRALYCQYDTNADDNATRASDLLAALGRISADVKPLLLDDTSSPNALSAILESFKLEQGVTITFDISVTSNRFIIRALRQLLAYDVDLRIVYSEAALYHPTEAEYRADPKRWTHDPHFGTEHGVAEIVPMAEFPGNHLDPLPDFVMVFPSFKPDRARAVIHFIDPSLQANAGKKVLWCLGVPRLEEDKWRLTAMREINELRAEYSQVELSTFLYKETLLALEQAYSERANSYNISVAPFGSKLQSVAVALFCTMHPDVRVVSAKPKKYGVLFSDGCKHTWELRVGNTRSLRELLAGVGDLVIED